MPLITVGTLVDAVRELQLLEPAQLRQLPALEADEADSRLLARKLLERGWLTPFQINHLLQGRGEDLLFGAYLLQERVGEGGTGQVYKALHQRMRRVAAIKVIRKELLTDAEVLARFYREIQVASQVAHPNVVHAFDAGPVGERHFLAMEYVKGIDLARLVKQNGPLTVDQAVDYTRQAALGLEHIHSHGLVHRDLKPSNLLVMGEAWQLQAQEPPGGPKSDSGTHSALASTRFGIVKILDLGLARFSRHVDGEVTGTFSPVGGVMMGTPDYMAPEQALDFPRADVRSDIYSLGCTLYFLLTGEAPFTGGTLAQKLLWHQQSPPPPIQEKRPDVPDALAAVLGKMLAKQPDERYQLPRDLVQALDWAPPETETALQEEPAATSPELGEADLAQAGADYTASAPTAYDFASASNPHLAALAAAEPLPVALALEELEGLAGTALPAAEIGPGELTAILKDIPQEADGEPARAPAPFPWGVALVVGGCLLLLTGVAGALLFGSRPTAVEETKETGRAVAVVKDAPRFTPSLLDALEPGTIPFSERFPWQPQELVAVLGEHRQRHWGVVEMAAFTPDGLTAFSYGSDQVLRFWNLGNGLEQTAYPGQKNWVAPVLSPDGKQVLAGGADNLVRLWDAATGNEVKSFAGHTRPAQANAFAADGKTVASASRDGFIKVWDVASGKEKASVTRDAKAQQNSLALSTDGNLLLHQGADFSLRVWDLQAGKERFVLRGHRQRIGSLGFSYDGRWVVTTSEDRTVRIWPTDTGKGQTIVTLTTGQPTVADMAPDGKTLAYAATDGQIRLVEVPGGQARTLTGGHMGQIITLSYSPDSQLLVSGAVDGTVRFWDAPAGRERLGHEGHPHWVRLLAFSPDGKTLASSIGDRTVNLWDLPILHQRLALKTLPDGVAERVVFGLAFTPGPNSLLVRAQVDGAVRLWDPASGKEIRTVRHKSGVEVRQLAVSPNGKHLALALDDATVRVLELENGKEVASCQGHKGRVLALAFAPNGRTLASGGDDGTVRLWEAATGKAGQVLQGTFEQVQTLAYSADGKLLAASGGEDRFIHLWDTATGKARPHLAGHAQVVPAVAFAPTGSLLASAGFDGRVIVWNAETNEKLHEWPFPGPVFDVAFAPDGRHLATGNSNGTVYFLRLPPSPKP